MGTANRRGSLAGFITESFAPYEENAIWQLMVRFAGKRGMNDRTLGIVVSVFGALAALVAVGNGLRLNVSRIWVTPVSLFAAVILGGLYCRAVAMPVWFTKWLERRDLENDLLSTPMPSRIYADAFLSYFLALSAYFGCLAVATIAFWAACQWDPSQTQSGGEILAVSAILLVCVVWWGCLVWLLFWSGVAGGLFSFLPVGAALIVAIAVVSWPRANGDLFVAAWIFTVVMIFGGWALYRYCRAEYAEEIRKRIFK